MRRQKTGTITMALPGPSNTSTSTNTRRRRDQDRGEDSGGEGWAPNATNTYHRVDFRRAWVPSPEMAPAPLPDAPLPGIEEDEDELEFEHGHEQGHEHPPGSRCAPRTRSARAYVFGCEENPHANVNPSPNPNPSFPAPKRSASGSTGTGTASSRTASVHMPTHTHTTSGYCKRPLRRSTGTFSGNGHGAGAAAYVQQPHTHPGDANDLPVHVPRVRQAPATAASARPCARPRPPACEQERECDQGDSASLTVRRKSWLSVLSPKKLFSSHPRAYRPRSTFFHAYFHGSLSLSPFRFRLCSSLASFRFHFAWEAAGSAC